MWIDVSCLLRKFFEMNASTVNSDRCTRLHTVGSEAERDKLLRETCNGWLSHATTRKTNTSHVHQTIQERTVSKHDTASVKLDAQLRPNTANLLPIEQKLIHGVLPEIEIRDSLDCFTPNTHELSAIALCTRTPHGWSLAPIKHTELDRRAICHTAHPSTQGVDLTNDLPLGNAPHSGVATHLSHVIHVAGDEQCPGTQSSRRSCRFAASMTRTHHDHVVIKLHLTCNSYL